MCLVVGGVERVFLFEPAARVGGGGCVSQEKTDPDATLLGLPHASGLPLPLGECVWSASESLE